MRAAHELVNFHAPLCEIWATISRRSLDGIQGTNWVENTLPAVAPHWQPSLNVQRIPEALAGLQAMYQAMRSAQWIVANSLGARADLEAVLAQRGTALEQFTGYYKRLRALRNDVVAHLDRDFFRGDTQSITVDRVALYRRFLRNGEDDWHEYGYSEWDGWLTILETWVNQATANLPSPDEPGRDPFQQSVG